jgi:hypothetical protein
MTWRARLAQEVTALLQSRPSGVASDAGARTCRIVTGFDRHRAMEKGIIVILSR